MNTELDCLAAELQEELKAISKQIDIATGNISAGKGYRLAEFQPEAGIAKVQRTIGRILQLLEESK